MANQGAYNSVGHKWCYSCKDYHPISAFGKSKRSKDGLGFICTVQYRISKEADPNRIKLVEADAERGGVLTHQAIQSLRLTLPMLKLANPYEYKRPDAWDNYLEQNNKII